MLHTTAVPPKGIDVPIAKLQKDFYERMRGAWGLSPEDWECFPRVYRNRHANGYVAEAQFGVQDYRDVYQDDTKAVVSFFGAPDQVRQPMGQERTTTVHLVLFCNLVKLKPTSLHRSDEEVHEDVIRYFDSGTLWGFDLDELVTGVENVLQEYPGTRRNQLLEKADIHPHHCFRLNLSLRY